MFRSQLTAGGIDVVTVPGTQRRLDTMFHQNIIKVQSFFLIDGEIPVFIDLIVGNQVTMIPNYLFYGSDITEVRFEAESVCQTIGAFAFGQCRGLSLVSLPASLTEIGEECFAGDGIENCNYSGTTGQIQTIWSGVQPTDFVITCSDGIWPEQDEG